MIMDTKSRSDQKPHALCIPYPAQGHINPMLMLSKLLHFHGFHITFVNTEYNHKRLLKSRAIDSVSGLPDFRFEAIPDGLPSTNEDDDTTQDIPSLSDSTSKNCLVPFRNLVYRINGDSFSSSSSNVPPVSCIVSDGSMSFTLDVAEEFGIPEVLLWTPSACGVLAYTHYHLLVQRGYIPIKDESYLINGYLETPIEWIPGMKNIRLKDLPSFIRTTDPNSVMLNYVIKEISQIPRASALILNTFDSLEQDVIHSLSAMFPHVYTIGPLHLLAHQIPGHHHLRRISSNLWKESSECIKWLNTKQPNSVLLVNFGSIAIINPQQISEFAWGLANSKKQFLWIIRPDLFNTEILDSEFLIETKDRGMLAGWCPQEEILKHEAIAGFLSHMGWNSTIESLSAGIPLLCWPFFAEQMTNCKYACDEWGIGLEISNDVKRDEIENVIRELMDGEKGKDMKKKSVEWKIKAEEAIRPGGSSYHNFEKMIAVLTNKKIVN